MYFITINYIIGYINKIRLHTVRQRKIKNNYRIIIVRVVIIK